MKLSDEQRVFFKDLGYSIREFDARGQEVWNSWLIESTGSAPRDGVLPPYGGVFYVDAAEELAFIKAVGEDQIRALETLWRLRGCQTEVLRKRRELWRSFKGLDGDV